MLDLRKLRYFVAVADTENVGRAAARLHVSPSPLSRQIAALEDHLGTALFTRERKRLKLTPAGRQLLDDAQALLGQARRLETRVRDAALDRSGSLAIGFVEGAVHGGVLQAAIKRFVRADPSATIELTNLRSREQFEALRTGSIDVGFTYSPPMHDVPGCVASLMLDEAFVLAMPVGHRLAKRRFDVHALDGAPFIGLPQAVFGEARHALLGACATAGFVPDVRFEVADPSIALDLVDAGVGLAIVQRSLCRTQGRAIVFRALPASFTLRARIYQIVSERPRPLAARFVARGARAGRSEGAPKARASRRPIAG